MKDIIQRIVMVAIWSICSESTSAQELFQGCGILFQETPECMVFMPQDNPDGVIRMKLADPGIYQHSDIVYVSGTYELCDGDCNEDACFIENTLELCDLDVTCGNFQFKVDPFKTTTANPVSIALSGVCSDCYIECNVIEYWISPSEYRLEWYFDRGDPCLNCPFMTTHTDTYDIDLGMLPADQYTISASIYAQVSCDDNCATGQAKEHAEITFDVTSPIPAVSQWGLVVFVLLLMVSGTICLRRNVKVFVILCLTCVIASSAVARVPNLNAPHHPERLIVRFRPNVTAQEKMNTHAAIGATRLKEYQRIEGLTLIKVPAARLENALDHYLNNPNILYAEPDYQIKFTGIPNDTSFNVLWGMHNTGQDINGVAGKHDSDIDAQKRGMYGRVIPIFVLP